MSDKNQRELTDGEEETDEQLTEADPQASNDEYPKGTERPLDHGVKVRGKVKRGTGTRDQDELLIEGRGKNAAEAAADFEEALSEAEEREWADRLRALQPENEPQEDGEGDE